MDNTFLLRENSGADQLIDIKVIFDIYGEEGEEIICYALGAFSTEAKVYVTQISNAVRQHDAVEAERLFHSLHTMAGMIGARDFARLAGELEILLIGSAEFVAKYREFCTLWQKLVIELEHYLV